MHIANPKQTLNFVEKTFTSHFSDRSTTFLCKVFGGVEDLFAGRYPGYQGSDTAYHDLTHTCEATVAVVRLLDGHIKRRKPPSVSWRDFELAVAAILLHDSGFMKQIGDNEGTGAKYTLVHVSRSGEFAAKFLPSFGVAADEIRVVQLAIDCTGVAVDVNELSFRSERERFLGCIIGTGDILGQMAAPNYPERLPGLYREFSEAAAHSKARKSWITDYTSAEELMRKTCHFYEGYVKWMLETQWDAVHEALLYHFQDGKNHYFKSIETNIERIEGMLQTANA
ncbi:hypothetical protein MYX84_06530 [Acidobacteria bacterium AH-259-O06]|nr:hypothetical protein [Acidobacteria bacterium AH-259-O06]